MQFKGTQIKKKKKPVAEFNSSLKKEIRSVGDYQKSSSELLPAWRFSNFDADGVFERKTMVTRYDLVSVFADVFSKLINYESMTWNAIERNTSCHPMPIENISPAAQKRLVVLNFDDHDYLYQLEITNKKRLWGIRDKNILHILWWDPEHKVYPFFKDKKRKK